MLSVGCWSLCVVCCSLFDVCWLCPAGCCFFVVVCCRLFSSFVINLFVVVLVAVLVC